MAIKCWVLSLGENIKNTLQPLPILSRPIPLFLYPLSLPLPSMFLTSCSTSRLQAPLQQRLIQIAMLHSMGSTHHAALVPLQRGKHFSWVMFLWSSLSPYWRMWRLDADTTTDPTKPNRLLSINTCYTPSLPSQFLQKHPLIHTNKQQDRTNRCINHRSTSCSQSVCYILNDWLNIYIKSVACLCSPLREK